MRIGLIGDLHGETEWAERQISLSKPDFCLQVGDYWAYDTIWEVPVYWCLGNHEGGVEVALLQNNRIGFPNNYIKWLSGGTSLWQKGGEIVNIEGISVVFLPGKVRIDPYPGPAGYEQDIWQKCMAINDKVDIVVSHGCAFSFKVNFCGAIIQCEEIGITQVVQHLSPEIAVSGHNHEQLTEIQEGIILYRMGIANERSGGYQVIEL
jgi:predicted phosphodiesterase